MNDEEFLRAFESRPTSHAVKRVELVQELTRIAGVFIRRGGKLDSYQNPRTRMCRPIPRHREIKDDLARAILKWPSD